VYQPPTLSQDGNDSNKNGQTLTETEDDEVQEPEEVPADDSSSKTSNQHCTTNKNKVTLP
jgi:hypothetical protein